jgi:DNA-binding Xre family transcriptional regulator
MAQSKDLAAALKTALKAQRLTYAGVAKGLGLSEASVKRLFASGNFTLQRLEQICAMLHMEISDLSELAVEQAPKFTALTPAQEEALLSAPKLLLMAYLVLSHWRFGEIIAVFAISETEAISLLAQLDRLGLIQLLPGNRIKLLTTPNFTWRKDGPVQQFLEKSVLPEYLRNSFRAPGENMKFVGGLLSRASLQRLHQSVDKLAREFDELVEADAVLPLSERNSCAALLAVRPWEFSQFARFKRRV